MFEKHSLSCIFFCRDGIDSSEAETECISFFEAPNFWGADLLEDGADVWEEPSILKSPKGRLSSNFKTEWEIEQLTEKHAVCIQI